MLRITPFLLLVFAVTSLIADVRADDPPVSQLFEQAIYQEQAVGDLHAALDLYQKIVKKHAESERVAAEAQLHIGLIQLKLGEHDKAAKVLERLAEQYPAQRQLMHDASVGMPPVIGEAIAQIRANYIEEIDDEVGLTEAALRGVLDNLDRYSAFIDASALQNMTIGTAGRLVGIGAVLEEKDGGIFVTNPLPGSPAEEAGVEPGDQILSIDGQSMGALDSENRMKEVLGRIRGKAGKSVRVEVMREDSKKPETLEIVRRAVKLESVLGARRDASNHWVYRLDSNPEIGYIRIKSFTESSPSDMRRALSQLEREGIKGLIIDIRHNGGGLMSSTIEIADMFLATGVILEVQGRHQHDKVFEADTGQLLKGIPIVLLVDRDTASAAEILAGSLQECGRAVVVGERTFGKGTVQGLFPLRSGGAIRLTTAKFYLANGENLEKPIDPSEEDRWGVDPNEEMGITSSEEQRQALAEYRSAVDMFGNSEPVSDAALEKAIDFIDNASEN